MKINRIFLILLIGMFLGACTQDLPLYEQRDFSYDSMSDKISLKEALHTASVLFSELEGNTRTIGRSVSSVAYITCGQNTRSTEGNDTMYYMVNYTDDSGFAVLSANRKIGSVFAISQEGNISFEDTLNNKGLAYFFSGLNSLAQTHNTSSNVIPNITQVQPVNPFDSINIIQDFELPKLNENVRSWPGNKRSPLYGKYSNIAISISQAMTYFRKPSVFTSWDFTNVNRPMNWNLINDYTFSPSSSLNDSGLIEIEALLSAVENVFVGDWNYFECANMNEFGERYGYEIEQLYSPSIGVGGHEHQEPMSSNAAVWRKALKENRVIVSLNRFGTESLDEVEIVSWVVDGYVKYIDQSRVFLAKYNTDTMFHCVWGRGPTCNGYFAFMADTEYFVPAPIVKDSEFLNSNMPLDSNVRPLHYTFRAK